MKTTGYVFSLPEITSIKLFLEYSYKTTLYGRVLNAWVSLFAIFLKQNKTKHKNSTVCHCFHWCPPTKLAASSLNSEGWRTYFHPPPSSVSVLTQIRQVCPYSFSALLKIQKSLVQLSFFFHRSLQVRGRRKNIHLVALWLSSKTKKKNLKFPKTHHSMFYFKSLLTNISFPQLCSEDDSAHFSLDKFYGFFFFFW